ncbi:MAG: iduronate sulfatase, partial [Verrucomicrobiota bacterium]|nr:iduronate sulfatase [Verrucomicrobiota bacterium]
EEIPAQTSADYRLRGNCHYMLTDTEASGERLVSALLYAGAGSYIEFIIDLPTAGTYHLEGTIAMSGTCSVFVDDVKNDAAQADAGYPMKRICTLEPSKKLTDVSMGVVHFKKPGLKIIRFATKQKQEVKLDRLRVLKKVSALTPKKPGK